MKKLFTNDDDRNYIVKSFGDELHGFGDELHDLSSNDAQGSEY